MIFILPFVLIVFVRASVATVSGTSVRLIVLQSMQEAGPVHPEIVLESIFTQIPQAMGNVSINQIKLMMAEIEHSMAVPLWLHEALVSIRPMHRNSAFLTDPLAIFVARAIATAAPESRLSDEDHVKNVLKNWVRFCIEPLEAGLQNPPPCHEHDTLSTMVLSSNQRNLVLRVLADEEHERVIRWTQQFFTIQMYFLFSIELSANIP